MRRPLPGSVTGGHGRHGTAHVVPEKEEKSMTLTMERMRRALDRTMRDERGASTAEYAITVLATVDAVGHT